MCVVNRPRYCIILLLDVPVTLSLETYEAHHAKPKFDPPSALFELL